MLQSLIKIPTSQKKIEPQFYMIHQKATIDSALRIFQYIILTNTLYLNKHISKLNAAVCPPCSLCSQEQEDVLHLFCYCRKTQILLSPQFSLSELTQTLSILGN